MKASKDSKGYPQIRLSVPVSKLFRVHRLVAEAFLSNPTKEITKECSKSNTKVLVNHIDENRCNACSDNLECVLLVYSSYKNKENRRKGSESYQAILTEDDVKEIIKLLTNKTFSQETIAAVYGVKQITISNLWTGRSWNHITGFPVKPRTKSKEKLDKISKPLSCR